MLPGPRLDAGRSFKEHSLQWHLGNGRRRSLFFKRIFSDMDFGFTADQRRVIDRVFALVRERIALRATHYDLSFERRSKTFRTFTAKVGCSPI